MMELSYRRHRFPPVVIQHAVWLYLRLETGSHMTLRWRRQSRANSSLKANSLLAGKIQGTSSILASGVRITDRNYDEDQCLTGKFPTQRNRELIVP